MTDERCNKCGGPFRPCPDGLFPVWMCSDCGRTVPAAAMTHARVTQDSVTSHLSRPQAEVHVPTGDLANGREETVRIDTPVEVVRDPVGQPPLRADVSRPADLDVAGSAVAQPDGHGVEVGTGNEVADVGDLVGPEGLALVHDHHVDGQAEGAPSAVTQTPRNRRPATVGDLRTFPGTATKETP